MRLFKLFAIIIFNKKFIYPFFFLKGQADVDVQDHDGWTPLHAAAHWGQKEAAEMLVENFCNMDVKNYVVSIDYKFF